MVDVQGGNALFKRVIYSHENIVFKDPAGLIVHGWFIFKEIRLHFPDHLSPHNFEVIKLINFESNLKVSRTVSKSTKHGYASLILPTKPFKTDLTICVDISSNPGPDNSEKNTCSQPSNPPSARRHA
jgi:hypothetical protein